ncbi:hypothetical protein [Arthrobacter zhaoxinii]|uniref:hypothetical protein n=1 Tax=Arthrobacter zhaoxinii TaxID=2964616 RepID=UPI0021038CBF|nr:hypothetical protein [Arthrobacter zhaoxinii]MCQ2001315.1 hypothetical protein [Arthrobacter zhaoxinii]
MRNIAKRKYAAALLAAAALALSACSATEEAQAGDTTPSATPSTAPTPTEKPQAGPEPVSFDPSRLEMVDESSLQTNLAQQWVGNVSTNAYGLSGQYTLDGNDPANIAKLWSNYFSDDLLAKLTAAGVNGDVSGFGSWAIMALAPSDSTDPIKASPSCSMEFTSCNLVTTAADGSRSVSGNTRYETLDTSVPNRVAYDYDLMVPVSLTDHGNAEGVLKGLLKVDITFVENPTPGDGRPPFLIDSIKNDLVDANADLATNFPELAFAGGAR